MNCESIINPRLVPNSTDVDPDHTPIFIDQGPSAVSLADFSTVRDRPEFATGSGVEPHLFPNISWKGHRSKLADVLGTDRKLVNPASGLEAGSLAIRIYLVEKPREANGHNFLPPRGLTVRHDK